MLDKYLYTMEEVKTKFPAVITMRPFLGIGAGTVLKFDWASGKYVSITEEEDITEDYYYSGFAIALDPYLVKDSMGEYFAITSEPAEEPKLPVVEEPAKDDSRDPEEKVEPVVEPKKLYPLVIECSCGHTRLLDHSDEPFVNIYLEANKEDSFIELYCTECDTTQTLKLLPAEN